MPNNFIKGLNLIADPTGNTFLSGYRGVSKNGSNANTGADPNLPRQNWIDQDSNIYVLGDDKVFTDSYAFNTSTGELIGNTRAILSGSLTNNYILAENLENIDIIQGNNVRLKNAKNSAFVDCVTVSAEGLNANQNLVYTQQNCFFKDCFLKITTFPINTFLPNFRNNTIFNSSIKDVEIGMDLVEDDNFYTDQIYNNVFINCNIITRASLLPLIRSCYFEGCTFNVGGTFYGSVNDLLLSFPTGLPNNITSGANFTGNFNNLEYGVVSLNSSLLGSGVLGQNIGGVNLGVFLNQSVNYTATNLTIVGDRFTQTDQNLPTIIEFATVELPRITLSPKINLSGYMDFLNNIVRANQGTMPDLPEKLTIKCETADIDGILRAPQIYAMDYRMVSDGTGLYSGENLFHGFAEVFERVKFVKVTLELTT